jgi:hypothetical protein
MSQNKPVFQSDHDESAFCPEQQLKEAVTQLNQHAASLQFASSRQQDVSQYICDLLAELSGIASKANLVFLTYLIDVAHEEARLRSQGQEQPFL